VRLTFTTAAFDAMLRALIVITPGILGRREVAGVGLLGGRVDRFRHSLCGLGDIEPLGWDAVVLGAPVGEHEVEGVVLARQAAARVDLVDQRIVVDLIETQRRAGHTLQRPDGVVVGVDS
jgi:hypothetical protein